MSSDFNIRVFANPSVSGINYPAVVKYADSSANGKLNLALQISVTGLIYSIGQPDTMTLVLGLLEEPKFVYTVNGKALGEDIRRNGAESEMYSAHITVANRANKRGFSFGASNESNELLGQDHGRWG